MPKFSANLSMLFNEHDFLDRFAAAAEAGFAAVEYVSPYEHPPHRIAALLAANTLAQALFNLPAGKWEAGERGIACLPGREDEFRTGVDTAIAYAKALGCKTVNCLAGIKPPDVPRAKAFETLARNLAYASQALKAEGVLLVTEPINHFDMPGYLLNTSRDGLDAIDAAETDNLGLQYDIYHMQRMEGALAETMERLLPRIGHIQIADTPGRHEPGTGEINFNFLLRHLDRIGYRGYVGCEYRPRAGTREGLAWMKEFV
jgi:hydroxypyruvate isomerase